MGKLNSYAGVAYNDYLFAKSSLVTGDEVGNYNVTVSLAAQSGEKYLKAVIEKCFVEDPDSMGLLHSHNLRAIYNKIITKYKLSISSRDCKWLGDFYFDARYTGDDFVEVNKEDAEECLQIVEMLRQDVSLVLEEEEKQRFCAKESLRDLKAFQ